jgi:hypothetical protein
MRVFLGMQQGKDPNETSDREARRSPTPKGKLIIRKIIVIFYSKIFFIF